MPPRKPNAPVYLPVDRAFTLAGARHGRHRHADARTHRGRRNALARSRAANPAHVRSIDVFGSTRERVEAGARVALEPARASTASEVARGQAIVGREFSARAAT